MGNINKVLITGGAGFIGSHLCKRLLAAKIKPVVLDNLSVGKKENIPKGCQFTYGDIQDFPLVKKILKEVDAIYHLAANVTIRGSVEKFYEDAQTNIMGTLNLLRVCKFTKRIKKFVFTSSMAVYADSPTATPVSEEYFTQPISPYGVSKLASERFIQIACSQMGIENTILRLFNTYGPGQTFTPYVGVITIFINKLLDGKPPLIFGDGKQCRDFIYVEDVTECALRVLKEATDGKIFNVGTGIATSVNKIASLLIKKINPAIKPIYQDAQPGELKNSIADNSSLYKAIKFKPRIRLEKKVEEVIEYIKKTRKN